MKQLTSAVLKSVSRSFYLSLKVLPSAVRPAIAHAYLLARAADTIADTRLIDRRLRVTHLLALREELDAAKPGRLEAIVAATRTAQSLDTERTLLERLPDCLAGYRALAPDDRRRVRGVLGTIIEGMTEDLTRFPGEDEGELAALETRAELDRYTYLVAGCVGEFWTEVHVAHRPRLRHWDLETMAALGIRFGKALQLTNVLRDLPRDLRQGRCYLPSHDLSLLGLEPRDLRDPPPGDTHAPGLRLAASHRAAHPRSPRPGAQLARPRRRAQGSPLPRVRHDGAIDGDGVVHSRAEPQGAPAPRADPPVISIFQIDAFAERPFGGNPPAVVLDAQRLSEPQMQSIAFEMRVAGTAFLLPATRGGYAHWRLRLFTPTREVPYSGHTTMAAVHALGECGRLRNDHVVFETLGGPVKASVVSDNARRLIWLEPKVPELHPFTGQLAHVREALGLAAAAGWAHAVTTPDHDLLVPGAVLEGLRALRPNLSALGEVAAHAGVRGVCVVSRETVDRGSATHCRFFAPHFGIPEDIVTGSVHSAIGIWLFDAGLLHPSGTLADFTAEQGDGLGRPGRLRVELQLQQGKVSRVRVGGSAVTVLAGSIAAPDP